MLYAKFGRNWFSGSRGEAKNVQNFKTDVQLTPTDKKLIAIWSPE